MVNNLLDLAALGQVNTQGGLTPGRQALVDALATQQRGLRDIASDPFQSQGSRFAASFADAFTGAQQAKQDRAERGTLASTIAGIDPNDVGPITPEQSSQTEALQTLPKSTLQQILLSQATQEQKAPRSRVTEDAFGNPIVVVDEPGGTFRAAPVEGVERFGSPSRASERVVASAAEPTKLEENLTKAQEEEQELAQAEIERDELLAQVDSTPPNLLSGLKTKIASAEKKVDRLSEPSEIQKSIDKEFGKEFSKFLSGGFADVQKNIDQLVGVRQRLVNRGDESFTGREFAFVPSFGGLDAVITPESTALKERVEEVVQRNLREILGAQFTQKEGERLIARAFNQNLPEEENIARLDALIGQMETSFKQKLEGAQFLKNNGTLKGFTGSLPSIADFDVALDAVDTQISGEQSVLDFSDLPR